MTAESLSTRGAHAASSPLRIDHEAFRAAMADRYHPVDNPTGALPLNVAENRLVWPELKAKVEEITRNHPIPPWVPKYASHRGALPFRTAAAAFLSRHLVGAPIEGDTLGVSAGATSTIEMTAFILADPGDVAVIPAPCYPVYRKDLGNMADVDRYDLVTHHDIGEISRGPRLELADLERAEREIRTSGGRFRMLVLTAPDNPTGAIYPSDLLAEIADWCIERQIHMVVNELYGLSLIDTTHPAIRGDYDRPAPFTSFGRIIAERRSDWLHLWYAVSKDFGISGFRVGLLHSHNHALLQAYENLNLTHTASNHTQWILQHMLADADFVDRYVELNQARLTQSYVVVVEGLRRAAIPYVPSRGSLFAWIDLSEFLVADSEEAELELWRDLFRESGVLITPGVGFGHTKRGLFRLVYPCVDRDELEVAMDRIVAWANARRNRTRSA
jgi:aspartate/methionine/tyrosine aminotransferase